MTALVLGWFLQAFGVILMLASVRPREFWGGLVLILAGVGVLCCAVSP